MRELSQRTSQFTDSVIRRMTRVANKYGAVNLSQGFPDFDPPEAITDRLSEVAGEGPHQYALTWGAKNFRDALAAKQEHFSGMKIDPESENINSHIVKPGQSIRLKIPMRAPTEKYHDDNKYYAAYTLVKNWNDYGTDERDSMSMLHDGHWDRTGWHAMFCPVYFYIYVPE